MDKKAGLPERVVARLRRDVPLAALDFVTSLSAYLLVLVLRFEGAVPGRYWMSFWLAGPIAVGLHLMTNQIFGLYGQMWRYASVQEARRVLLAGGASSFLVVGFGTGIWLGSDHRLLPLSIIVLGPALSVAGFGAVRFQSRLFAVRRSLVRERPARVLLVGAGEAGSIVLKDILQSPAMEAVGLLDDDPRKHGRSLHGVPVLGGRALIPGLAARLKVDHVLLAIPSAQSDVVRDVAALCEEAEATLKVLPSVEEIVGGRVSLRDVRDLRIEDLLGRKQVETDLEAVGELLHGRRVLVTGAGGSIGSEVVRQVLAFGPAELVIFDHDETHLHDVMVDLPEAKSVIPVLADIRDREKVFAVLMRHRPEVVFHAAAHKHVPVLETHPEEALFTNIIGTANLADAAVAADVARFVLISTDKAIRPVSVMGASKRFAEQIMWSLSGRSCRFCAVRFGNVLGSRGSVLPTFMRQLARGGPVTVTDPSMARYFMSVREAVQLVLQAASLSRGGEVFTLEMGQPVLILDLARKLIRLSGRIPGRDVEIRIVGVRPGEKIMEDIVDLGEERLPSGHPGIDMWRPPPPERALLKRGIWELESLAREGSRAELAARIKSLAGKPEQPVAVAGEAS